jgi:hypothetical protein
MGFGFFKYKPEQSVVQKVNSIRRGQSLPELEEPPVLDAGSVLFSPAESAHNEPRSCYNCPFFNYEQGCAILKLPDALQLKKFIWPRERTADSKPIEFWPVCGYWVYGEPNFGAPAHRADVDPTDAGLGWVNAPRVGLERSGTSCGGRDGGDDCDLWQVSGDDKRAEQVGFCRVLQRQTANLDCCAAWRDDDFLTWQMVLERMKEDKV